MVYPDGKNYPMSLLYVEDDAVTRELVGEIIPRKFPHFSVHTAENGKAGLELYKKYRPEIVVTDINMPVMNGILMAAEIRHIEPDVIIIAVTAYSETNYLLNAIEIGINHYVLKPIDYKMLFNAIEKSIRGIKLKKQLNAQHDYIRKLSRTVEQSPFSIVITDVQGTIEYVNPQFIRVTGYTSDEVCGQNMRALKSGANGTGTYDSLWRSITAGKVWRGELLNRKKGGELFWEEVSIAPVPDENGVITHFVAVKADVTCQKNWMKEIEKLNATLEERARELEAANGELESFSYTVSHDLRSPLTNINGYCQLILELCDQRLEEKEKGYIRNVLTETKRMDELIRTLLDFSRLARGEISRETVNLTEMAHAIAADLQQKEPHRSVSFHIAEGLTADGDPNLLAVAMENLLSNAWKYTGRKETGVIEFGRAGSGSNVFFVRDNGVGFGMNQADKLFKLFERLHDCDSFEGHGIGLCTVRRIIQRHGGHIWAVGEEGKGAVFYFTLSESEMQENEGLLDLPGSACSFSA